MSNRRLKLIAAPTVEPLTVEEAKDHLRVITGDDDAYIATLIKAAREWLEGRIGRALLEQEWELIVDDFYCAYTGNDPDVIELAKGTLRTVSSITYVDVAGSPQTLPTSVYDLDTDSVPGRIFTKYLQVWPATRGALGDVVRIKFKAGYGTSAASVPAALKQALLLIIGHFFEHRETEVTGTIVTPVQFAVEALIMNERLVP